MSSPKSNPIPRPNLRRQSIPGEFNSSTLALTPEGKPSGLKELQLRAPPSTQHHLEDDESQPAQQDGYTPIGTGGHSDDLDEIDTGDVSSFIDYTATEKQPEGQPPIEIEIRDAEMFAQMVAREPDKYYRLLQNYHLKLTRAELRAAQDHDIIQDLQASEALADNTRQETEDDLRISERDVQRLKKAEIVLIAQVTEKEGTIKYLQSQLNEHIRNNTEHLPTTHYTTQVSTPPATSPTQRLAESQRRAASPDRDDSYNSDRTQATIAGSNTRYPDPPVFQGDRKEYSHWKMQIREKLTQSACLFPREDAKIGYIIGRTKGTPFNRLFARWETNGPRKWQSHQEVLDDLDLMYRDHDLVATSRAKLRALKMSPTESFDEFYVKFQEYTGVLSRDDAEDQEDLLEKVTYRLSHAAASHNYNDVHGMVAALRKIERRLNQISTANPRPKASTQKPSGPTTPTYTRSPTPTTNTGANINLSIPTFPRKLLDGERELLQKLGRCYRCRQEGCHRENPNCPMARFGNRRLTPNFTPRTPNTSLRTATVQDEDAATAVESDTEAENAKSQP